MGSDKSHFNILLTVRGHHFNISLIVRVKVTKTVSVNGSFGRERRAKVELKQGPSAYQSNTLPLGETGSLAGPGKVVSLYCRFSPHLSR